MCTVTFIKHNGKVIITSNRDEKITRPKAIHPKTYFQKGKKIFYPKDPKAGGTWYVIDEFGNVIVLLNGAEEKHIIKEKYRKSRGVIVIEIIESENLIDTWEKIELKDIEPFTLIVYTNNSLYKLQWNEEEKIKMELDLKIPHIWSSSTLYSKEIRKNKENLFEDFIKNERNLNSQSVLKFHKFTQNINFSNEIVTNNDSILKTLSITQTVIQKNKLNFKYLDLQTNELVETNLIII